MTQCKVDVQLGCVRASWCEVVRGQGELVRGRARSVRGGAIWCEVMLAGASWGDVILGGATSVRDRCEVGARWCEVSAR